MQRPEPAVTNYELDVLPLLRRWPEYQSGFLESVQGNIYAVANFNRRGIEPSWCRQQFNAFDQRIGRLLLGRRWSEKPNSERPSWVAVPERATYLHYNSLWNVPAEHQRKFLNEAPDVWRQVVPGGQFDVQVIGNSSENRAAVIRYCVKAFHPRWTLDSTVTSMELRRRKGGESMN